MDYDDNDFQNHNLHLAAGEATNTNKFPNPYALPKFDFDDTLNPHLRFETEVFLGIEANEDSNWIEDFSRPSTSGGIVFSSAATESCAISRHNNVWSEATSSESVEMLLNSVGQDEVIVRQDNNNIKKSEDSHELGCTVEQMELDQTCNETGLPKEEPENLGLNPPVDETPGESSVPVDETPRESSVSKTDAGQDEVIVREDTVKESEDSHELGGTVEQMESGQTCNEKSLSQKEPENLQPHPSVDETPGESSVSMTNAGQEEVLAKDASPIVVDESSVGDKNTVWDSNTATVEAVDTTDHDKIVCEATDSLLDQTEDEANAVLRVETEDEANAVSRAETEDGANAVLRVETEDEANAESRVETEDEASARTSATVEAPLELAGQSTTLTGSVVMEKPELLGHQHMEDIASGHESIFPTETQTQVHLPVDSIVEPTIGGMSVKSDNNEDNAHTSSPKPVTELAVSTDDRDQDAKSPQIVSQSIVSESVDNVSGGSASNLAESKSQPDTTPVDKSDPVNDGTECEAFPVNPEELHHLSQVGAPDVSLTSSADLHMAKTSSDENERGSFSETEKVSFEKPESDQTGSPMDASSSENQMDQQALKHTEKTQQSTQYIEDCPASEGSKDSPDADAAGQVQLQQPEEKDLEENVVTGIENPPETHLILEKEDINEKPEDINEKPDTSSYANLESEAGKDDREENMAAVSEGTVTAEIPVSHAKVDAMEIGDSRASTFSEPSVKSHVSETENPTTNLGTPSPAIKTSEIQLNKTEANSVTKAEGKNISPGLNRNETFSSGMNSTSSPLKAGDMSGSVGVSQATLPSQIVEGTPSKSSIEKTAAKSSKPKSERKPRRTTKSAGKETSRKGSSVKVDTPYQQFQSGGKRKAVNQTSASSIQIIQSTEKQQNLQSPVLKAFGTISTPAVSLPDLNSSALSSILRRPFTDLQQVQLRSQIFVYGALIQGTAPDEAYMISAFGGPDGGKASWEKPWRACVARAQKAHIATPETPLQSRAGKTEISSVGHASSKESSAMKPIIPLSSPLWSSSTPLDTLQSSSMHRGSIVAHQTPPVTNIVGHNSLWMSPLPYRNPWLASPQTSGFDVGSRFPVYPVTEPVKVTSMKESPLPGTKHVQSGTSSNVFKGTSAVEPISNVVAPAQQSTGTKSRKRKKMPVSVEPSPSILNSLKQTESVASPLVSISTYVPITTTPANLASNAGTLPNVDSFTVSPVNLGSTFSGKKLKSSLPSPIFGGNLLPGNLEVKQKSVLSEDTIDNLQEAKRHAEDASRLAAAAVSHSEYVWRQIGQQRHAGLQTETEGRLASAAVAIAAAAAVAKAAAAAANVAANAAMQAKLMAEEASFSSASDQGNEFFKSHNIGQGTPTSIFKGEGAVGSSNSVLIAAREAAKKRVEAASAATKRADNMDSIVKAAELASEAVSQAGMLVSMGHPPSLSELVEAGPSNYWRLAQESQETQPCKSGVLDKNNLATSDGNFASLRTVQTELDGSVRIADGVSGSISTTGKKTKGEKDPKGADLAKNNAVGFEPAVGSKSLINNQNESEQIIKITSNEDIKEGSNVEVYKEGPGIRPAWYFANVLSIEDDKAYVLFNDLSVEQETDKLKDWVALKGEGDEAPKIRTARSVTALPYEGTRKRRRAAIGDPVWKIGDTVDSWVNDSWLEGVITEKNKNDENTVTVHFPAQGETLTIKAWNLRPTLVWKDGKWIECPSSGGNISSSHEGDTPKEKRPRLGTPALVAEVKDANTNIVDAPDVGKPPQTTALLDLGVTENTFNIGRSTRDGNKPDALRKRTGLQKPGSRVNIGGPTKPGKRRKFMDVHYVSEASTRTREPPKPVKPAVPQYTGSGSWRMPSKTISREKQTTISKPKSFKPAPKTKERAGAPSRMIPRKDLRNTTASKMESEDAGDQSGEDKGHASVVPSKDTGEGQSTSSSQEAGSKNGSTLSTYKGKATPGAGRLAKIEEDKALAESSLKPSDGMEPRRSNRRIQPTSRLLEGLQTSMMTSKIPSVSNNKSQSKK